MLAGLSELPGTWMSPVAKYDASQAHRRAMLAKVHLAKKELGLDDATYRAVLERVTGLTSAGGMTEAQLGLVLGEFRAKGWGAAKPRTQPRAADHPVARKARAMWMSLYHLGVVANPAERALEAFACRQLGVEKLQWADQGKSYKLIEALKAMAERNGWRQDVAADVADPVHLLKDRLVEAQWKRAATLQLVADRGLNGMMNWLAVRAGVPHVAGLEFLDDRDLDKVIRLLGEQIRAAKAGKDKDGPAA